MRYFDDINVGDRIALGAHIFTAPDIKTFAAQYDPQPFHMDEAAAANSHFGALCASGWHTVAAWMNLRVQYGRREDAERAARGEAIAKLGPSPGFRDLKWLKPVYAGDTIGYASEVVEKRVTRSRPGWGIIFAKNTGTNQNGELVLSFIGSGFVERRPLASALVARAFSGSRSLAALGAYNFAGDLGKMAVPAAASLLVVVLPWRTSLALLGLIGFFAALAILILTPRFGAEPKPAADAKTDGAPAGSAGGFPVLLSIGVIDSATRMGFLTFLPFLLT